MDFSHDAYCIVFGIFLSYVMDVLFSIVTYFVDKALFYHILRKDLKK